jgi:glycosyltransferase involved in cell wall biosynthesis
MSVSVVIPAFNEEASVAAVVEQLHGILGQAQIVHEILVVDDGSGDATAERAAAAGARVVRNPTNKGYGYSLLRGIAAASHELIAITDADSTYPAEVLPQLVTACDQYDMVIGSRTGRYYKGSWLKRLSRLAFRLLAEFTSGTRIPDINSGLRVFRRDFVLKHRKAISTGYSFTTTVTLIALLEGCHLLYVPISYHKRVGKSKVRWARDILRSLQIITEVILLYNPLKFFLLLAMVPLGLVIPKVVLSEVGQAQALPYWLAYLLQCTCAALDSAALILALGGVGFIVAAGRRSRE